MKKFTLAPLALATALLAMSACTKNDDIANNAAASEVTSNDEVVSDSNGSDANLAGADTFANDAAEPENATVPLGNAQ